MRSADGERTLLLAREFREQTFCAQHPEDRVPEELKPLVVLRTRHIHPIRRRRQRLFQKLPVLKRITKYLHDGDYTTSESIGDGKSGGMRKCAVRAVMVGLSRGGIRAIAHLTIHQDESVGEPEVQVLGEMPDESRRDHVPFGRRKHRRILITAAIGLEHIGGESRPVLREIPARGDAEAPGVLPLELDGFVTLFSLKSSVSMLDQSVHATIAPRCQVFVMSQLQPNVMDCGSSSFVRAGPSIAANCAAFMGGRPS